MSDIVERLRGETDNDFAPRPVSSIRLEAAAEIEHLQALLQRWIVWNGEGRYHDLEDETRRALAWRGDEGQF